MTTVVIPPELQAFLGQLSGRTELADADGNLVGVFTPRELAEAELYEKAKRQVDPALIERRKQEQGSVSCDEVKRRLASLRASG